MREGAQKGDVLVVWKLSQNLAHLVNTVQNLSIRGTAAGIFAALGRARAGADPRTHRGPGAPRPMLLRASHHHDLDATRGVDDDQAVARRQSRGLYRPPPGGGVAPDQKATHHYGPEQTKRAPQVNLTTVVARHVISAQWGWTPTLMRTRAWTLGIVFLAISNAAAQDQDALTVAPFRDRNRFSFGFPEAGDDKRKLEAQIAGDVLIWRLHAPDRLRFRVLYDDAPDSWHWSADIYGTALFRLRMLKVPGSPIPPPSFMPKVTVRALAAKQFSLSLSQLFVFHFVPYGHHSNGQSGCPLVGQERLPNSKECSTLPNPDAAPINVDTGDFSTNYFQLGFYSKTVWISRPGNVTAELATGLMYERHVRRWRGGLSVELWDRYGIDRMRYLYEIVARNVGFFDRIDTNVQIHKIYGVTDNSWAFAWETVMYLRQDAGVYYRYYTGRDYYNINFETKVSRTEIGVTFGWDNIRGLF